MSTDDNSFATPMGLSEVLVLDMTVPMQITYILSGLYFFPTSVNI